MAMTQMREPIGQVLTGDEYDALPENPRRELVDGVIRRMATPTFWHQEVVDALKAQLAAACPPELKVLREQEIRLGERLRRNPDLLVVQAAAYGRRRSRYLPSEVVLAIEVVSPGSETDDRREKPAQYAAGKIPHYWRVEIEPETVIHTFRLGNTGYLETGIFTSGDKVLAPGLTWAAVNVAALED
jgi:Uma2 family endonuclease